MMLVAAIVCVGVMINVLVSVCWGSGATEVDVSIGVGVVVSSMDVTWNSACALVPLRAES